MSTTPWEAYVKAVDRVEEARKLYWTRMSPFLTFEGFLLAGFALVQSPALAPPGTWLILLLGIFGVAVSTLWIFINAGSIAMLARRLERAKELQREYDDDVHLDVGGLDSDETILSRGMKQFPGNPAVLPGNWVPVFAALFWIAVCGLFVSFL